MVVFIRTLPSTMALVYSNVSAWRAIHRRRDSLLSRLSYSSATRNIHYLLLRVAE